MKTLKNKSAIVYVAVNSVNKKKYVGVTSRVLKRRIQDHKTSAKSVRYNYKFYNAIRKYGFENFNFYTLSKWENYQDALNEEVRVIALVKPEYNSTAGGEGVRGLIPNEETRKKMSLAHQGLPSNRKGTKHSEESKKKCSESRSGIPAWNRKKVICLENGKIFNSAVEADNFYNTKNKVALICNGKRKSCGGKHFAWYNENQGDKV